MPRRSDGLRGCVVDVESGGGTHIHLAAPGWQKACTSDFRRASPGYVYERSEGLVFGEIAHAADFGHYP